MKGRKLIPIPIKKAKGTYRKDRDRKSPTPSDRKPIAPSRLNKRAKQIFWHMTGRLNEIGLATRTHTEAIAELAMWMEEEERFNAILNDGEHLRHFYKTKDTAGNDIWKQHPAVMLRDKAANMVHKYLTEFGLTAASSQKVGVKPDRKKTNEFDDL